MFPMPAIFEMRPVRSLRVAIAAMLILLVAGVTIVSQQTNARANNEPYIRICLPLVDNGDLVEDYGYFTFHVELEANGQFAGSLSAGAYEGDFPCHDVPLANVNVPAGTGIVVKVAEYPAGWRNAADYPQYSIGQGLVSGDSVAFPFNGLSHTVYFYLRHAYNADLQVCNGIDDNGDATVDSGTWTYSLAVQGQQPFHTESVSAVEGQEENCLFVLLRDYGLATPVNIVVTEMSNPNFVDQPGYPKWQNFASDQSGTGSTMTLSYGADTNQRHGYFFHKKAVAVVQPTPMPMPPVVDDPAPPAPAPSTPTPMPTPAPVEEPADDEPTGNEPPAETPGEGEAGGDNPVDETPTTEEPAEGGSDQPTPGPGNGTPAGGETPLPTAPAGDSGGALPIEEEGGVSPAPGLPVATPSAPNTGNAGMAAERSSTLPLAIVLAVAGISGAGAVATAGARKRR